MRKPLLATLSAVLLLGACSTLRESKVNPYNWFGTSTEAPRTLTPEGGWKPVAADNRQLVDQVVQLHVDHMPGGAIVRAEGLPVSQGWWDAGLVAENDGKPVNGVLRFYFVAYPPLGTTAVSTEASRIVTASTFLSDQDLAGIRSITVRGARNERTSRR